ncbi:unnamed protein product [Protopolystoma xenopodis]|uniref:AGC-kinase C-terminal domain-containing protein n=1 Tax=Protopolystoma xenopodis TaxID=117903 RepID=A0A3S5FCS2_9PLAT|nr:unnamed protein product [Protopolystoma xenopodis]
MNPEERLGCTPNSSFADIVAQPFFRPLDFAALEAKQVPPPYRPEAPADPRDLVHFDPTFTNEPVCFSPDNPSWPHRPVRIRGFRICEPATNVPGGECMMPPIMHMDLEQPLSTRTAHARPATRIYESSLLKLTLSNYHGKLTGNKKVPMFIRTADQKYRPRSDELHLHSHNVRHLPD